MPATVGHRVRPHAADLIVEAWAPTPGRCLSEAVRALVGSFAAVGAGRPSGRYAFDVPALPRTDQLVAVFEEVLFLLDARGEVPLTSRVVTRSDGSLHVEFETVAVADVELAGSAPKGVSRSGLVFAPTGARWRCSAIVDV